MPSPLIGVTASVLGPARDYSPTPDGDPPVDEVALCLPYLRAVERAGGLAVIVAPGADLAVLDRLDGLVLSGGPDVDPTAYAAAAAPELGHTVPAADAFELAAARAALRRGLPLLAVCRGQQALNVALSGTLVQHLRDHPRTGRGERIGHDVEIAPDSRLAGIVGPEPLPVNSFHHQAIDRLADGLRVSGTAPDGVIEAVEAADQGSGFVVGVQWHPEMLVDLPRHAALFGALIASARG